MAYQLAKSHKILGEQQKIDNQSLSKQIELINLKKKKIEADIALSGAFDNEKQKLELQKYKNQIEWLKARKEFGSLAGEFLDLDCDPG